MSEGRRIIASGTAPNGDEWAVLYAPEGMGGRHDLTLLVNGGEHENGSGFDIPGVTEIGFQGGLKPGVGNFYLYGLVTSRIRIVRAEAGQPHGATQVPTEGLPDVSADDGGVLRVFVIVRPPVDEVTALVGLDAEGAEVQRIRLPGRPRELAN